MPRLIVRQFQLDKGVIDFNDQVPAGGFTTRVGPFAVEFKEFSTLPDASGRQNVVISLESGSRLAWAGDISVTPAALEGKLTLEGPFLGLVAPVRSRPAEVFDRRRQQGQCSSALPIGGETGRSASRWPSAISTPP